MAHHALGLAGHDVGVSGDAGAMKCGLAEPSLSQPEIAFAGQQSVAKQLGIGACADALGETGIARDQY